MEVYCTRPGCPRPLNFFADLDDVSTLRTVQQKFCMTCGMPLLLAGRYVPLKLLGKGGFGAAFLARDRYTPTMRACVVKQFQPAASLSPAQLQTAQALFEREAQVLESLGNKHPQIPDLLAFFEVDAASSTPGKTERFFYLVQEFIDGETLEEELARRGPFSEAEVLEVLREILKVLAFVHENGSIHRDIKPSNIMRRKDGRLFLLDFGAVRQVTASAGSSGGQASTGIYSMGFAPPEQMRGDVVYPATDLYALAVTCLMLLTGKQPAELYDSYANEWKWRSHAQVSDRLAAVLDQMLLPTPSQRFQSAEEVWNALKGPTVASAAAPLPSPTAPAAAVAPAAATALQPGAAVPPPSTGAAAPAQVMASTPGQPPASPPGRSLVELLGGAAFTGFEGGLLAIAILSLLGTIILSPLLWLLLMGGLIWGQSRRLIERSEMIAIAGGTLLLVWLAPWLNRVALGQLLGPGLPSLLLVAIAGALIAVVVTTLFRLIYLILSRVV